MNLLEVNLYILPSDWEERSVFGDDPSRLDDMRRAGKIWIRFPTNTLRLELRNHDVVRAQAMLNPECTIVAVLHDGAEVCTVRAADYN